METSVHIDDKKVLEDNSIPDLPAPDYKIVVTEEYLNEVITQEEQQQTEVGYIFRVEFGYFLPWQNHLMIHGKTVSP
jgi:hypothetical protein